MTVLRWIGTVSAVAVGVWLAIEAHDVQAALREQELVRRQLREFSLKGWFD